MSAGTQGIDVGDAVFSFLADTQDLDAGLAKVDAIPSRINPAEASVADLSGTLQGLGTYFGQAGAEAEIAGAEMQDAGRKAGGSMREARGEAMLLGEELGIHLPRHVQGFVAGLPGVGEALNAAFSATAVLFLIQALIEGTQKLTEWVGSTFIFTEEMKASNTAIAATNKTILEQVAAFNVAKKAMEEFGLSGSQLTQRKIDDLTESIGKNESAWRDASNTIYDYNHGGLHATASDATQASNAINSLTATLKAQREELAALQQQIDAQQIEEQVKAGEKLIENQKEVAIGRIELTKSEAMMRLAIVGGSYTQQLAIQQKAEDAQFQNELQAITKRISLLNMEGAKGKTEQQALYVQLEKLVNEHNAKVFESYATVFNRIREEAKALEPSLAQLPDIISNDLTKSLGNASDAAQQLGFTFSGDVYKGILDAKEAYDKLKTSGHAAQSDLLQGQMQILRAQIAWNALFGKTDQDDVKSLQKVTAEFDKLTGVVDKTHKKTHDMFAQMKLDLKQGVSGMSELKDIGGQAFNTLGQGIEQAVTSAILGQASIGQALKQATADALASLASQALVKALFYTGEGFAALAGFEEQSASQYFEAAGVMAAVGVAAGAAAMGLNGGGNGSSGGPSQAPADNSAAVQAGGAAPSTNVQRLAVGGLITKRTMVMMGDDLSGTSDASEAALPLDNPVAMGKIVDGFKKAGMTGGGGGGGTVVNVKGLISADNLKRVVKKINRGVSKNQLTLNSTQAGRIVKRSQ